MNEWTQEDTRLAAAQGWELRSIWCLAKKRVERQIFKDDKSKIFLTDEAARQYVAQRVATDNVAQRACRIVFNSKVGKTK